MVGWLEVDSHLNVSAMFVVSLSSEKINDLRPNQTVYCSTCDRRVGSFSKAGIVWEYKTVPLFFWLVSFRGWKKLLSHALFKDSMSD